MKSLKFSDIEEKTWDELRPYLDTAVLPVTGLSGGETPWKTAMELEYLRDALDLIEIPFKGRIVTYPAMHFISGARQGSYSLLLDEVCEGLKKAGFRFVVIVTAKSARDLGEELVGTKHADLVLRCTPDELKASSSDAKRKAAESMSNLWNGSQTV